jgi:hypothetical protein
MGYLGVQVAASISFGIPVPQTTIFLLEDAMNRLITTSEGRVRDLLARLDSTEERLFQSQERLAAKSLGEIELRDDEPGQLENEYIRWANRLADVMGCPLYAYSSRFKQGTVAGNIPVRG